MGVQEVKEERAGSGRNRGKFLQQANILQVKYFASQKGWEPGIQGTGGMVRGQTKKYKQLLQEAKFESCFS